MQTVYTTAALPTAGCMWTVPQFAFPQGKLQHYKANEQKPDNAGFLLTFCFRYRRCFIVSILQLLPAFSLTYALLLCTWGMLCEKFLKKFQCSIPKSLLGITIVC